MLFRWRRQLRAGLLDTTTRLLPVAVTPAPSASCGIGSAGTIELHLGQARVCIHGVPDPATLALVLQGLPS
jgi:hypothetical protein